MSDLNLDLPPNLANLNISSPVELQIENLLKKSKKNGGLASEEEKDYKEWLIEVNKQRDSYASYIGHSADMISFFSIAEHETKERIRFILLEKMFQPCGPPPFVPPAVIEKKKKKKSKLNVVSDLAAE